MLRLRRRLTGAAAVWLVCQCMALVAPLMPSASLATVGDWMCTCVGGTRGTQCPMHQSHKSHGQTNGTGVRDSCAPTDIAIVALVTGLGILPQPAAVDIDRTPTAIATFFGILTTRTELPDSPPPRA